MDQIVADSLKGPVPPEIFITDELAQRPARRADYRLEKLALQDLTERLVGAPDEVLPRFVELAMELTGGVSAGLSLYESEPAPGIFRWRHLRGSLAAFENAITPRNYSPCGVTLDQNRPVMTRHSERFYTWIADAKVVAPEVLLVPLRMGDGEPIGTLWIISDQLEHFDSGDARVASELAGFAVIALQLSRARAERQAALEQQEILTKEMSHRVKNLFAVAEGLVRISARGSDTKEEMVQTLVGRFHALAGAHSLIRRSFGIDNDIPRVSDLASLLTKIVAPHEHKTGPARFLIDGPALALGGHAINGMALTFHELATNAAKHGALRSDDGKISVTWDLVGDELKMEWDEHGGQGTLAPPISEGFGSKLLNDTIQRQFNGTLEHHWEPSGLRVTITMPVRKLAD